MMGSEDVTDVLISEIMATADELMRITDVAEGITSELSMAAMEEDTCSGIVVTSEDALTGDGIDEAIDKIIDELVGASKMVGARLTSPGLLIGSVSLAASSDEMADIVASGIEPASVETAETISAEVVIVAVAELKGKSVRVVEGIS